MDVLQCSEKINNLILNIDKVIMGKRDQVVLAVTALMTGEHLLIEDVSGVGKTLLAKTIAASLNLEFKRIQFTPDLLPSDITGSMVYDGKSGFYFAPGPIFTNVLLTDELNRATPRTQSALLEALDEYKVSIDGESHDLPVPFFNIGTLNPVEHYGTFPLPEGLLDRFSLKIKMGYPDTETEKEIVRTIATNGTTNKIEPVMDKTDLLDIKSVVRTVHISDEVLAYAQQIVQRTRTDKRLYLGASPRALISLVKSSQARALIEGRTFITPDDIKYLAGYALPHRMRIDDIETTSSAEVIEQIIAEVPITI